jgi:low affinity Fe/Cu permease
MAKFSFGRFAKDIARVTGHPGTFMLAALVIVVWAVTGPLFDYSNTWQLVINTGTTIITFLMVFLIQSTQNRDTEAMQIKLDEIIRSLQGAHNALLCLEELDEEELDNIRVKYAKIASEARSALQNGSFDTGVPEVEVVGTAEQRIARPVNPKQR